MRGTLAKERRARKILAQRIDELEADALRRERQADELRYGLLQLQGDVAASLPPGSYVRPYMEDRDETRGDRRMQAAAMTGYWPGEEVQ